MNDPNKIKDMARNRARDILAGNETFKHMSVDDQKKMYISVVEDQIEALRNNGPNGGQLSKAKKASDDIDDKRHEKGFEDGVDAFEDLVDTVDFPLFVKDLLKSVFDANLNVMHEQTQDYIALMKAATSELSKFIKSIDDTAAFAYLAENKSDEFGVIMEEDGDGNETMQLGNPNGETVDLGDNQVKAHIMDAKIKMAQEQRAILRDMVAAGTSKLVVEKGVVEAEVNFEFKGKRTGEKKDKALEKSASSSGTSKRAGTGFLSKLVGNASYGKTNSNQTTKFSVSSAKSNTEDELKAKLRGFVKIEFKTDYFKLDNFATMYGAPSEKEKQAALPSGG